MNKKKKLALTFLAGFTSVTLGLLLDFEVIGPAHAQYQYAVYIVGPLGFILMPIAIEFLLKMKAPWENKSP